MKARETSREVCEIQGLYGPLQVLEGKVQRVWALQEMQQGDWRTEGGARLKVLEAGIWNRGRGPDFQEAVVELDGRRISGDVEVHLYREDWWRHGHDLDRAYNRVVLHLVLFAGGMERPVLTAGGHRPAEWVMGPWMREDLESVVGGEPGLFGELAPELREWLQADQPEGIRERLRVAADRRWIDKESMARYLFSTHGWEGGLHRLMLFHLGYPFNRRPFYEMAEAFRMPAWRERALLERLRSQWEEAVHWTTGRPANRPERRLEAYLQLNHAVPDWSERLGRFRGNKGGPGAGSGPGEAFVMKTADIRKAWEIQASRKWLREEVFGGILNPSLVDRVWIDVCLPVLAASGRLDGQVGSLLWFHALPGSCPDGFRCLLREAGIVEGRDYPLCNGWIQGLYRIDEQLRLERIRSWAGRTSRGSQPEA
ncbi:MAG: DUF2851 family protein [Oceanipulchritudo sp.]